MFSGIVYIEGRGKTSLGTPARDLLAPPLKTKRGEKMSEAQKKLLRYIAKEIATEAVAKGKAGEAVAWASRFADREELSQEEGSFLTANTLVQAQVAVWNQG